MGQRCFYKLHIRISGEKKERNGSNVIPMYDTIWIFLKLAVGQGEDFCRMFLHQPHVLVSTSILCKMNNISVSSQTGLL